MSKKKATQTSEVSVVSDSVADNQPPCIAELLLNGTVILEAPTRDELAEMVNNIPADCKYAVGAVGRKRDGAFQLRVDTMNI